MRSPYYLILSVSTDLDPEAAVEEIFGHLDGLEDISIQPVTALGTTGGDEPLTETWQYEQYEQHQGAN